MPLIELNTWPTMLTEEKKEFIYNVTVFTIKLLKIVPDKIQVLITELEKEHWGKAGAVASDATFAEKSRVSNWETKESYDTPGRNVDGMAIIKIDIWNTFDQDTKDKWVNELTQVTSKYSHAPLDKVLILIRELMQIFFPKAVHFND
ncbi:TPA: tautomerase family protein [Bacillus cereus]|uniref:tautomerase family protein n=1 Tax=Bacillus sp. GbtcB14 TaxID=2824759 RepID=UPI000863E3A2|nr:MULTISPECIES: tautomerase family protein [Bacillus]SCM98707.1 4-oxalocrotonate tautomerase family enzyme [Bacillus cereus]HDX9627289.1 tautomerase family protein [Bacillus cereus]